MANIKVKDLTDTSSVTVDNQIMVLTNDAQNQVQNITVGNLLNNAISSDIGNVIELGTDGKLYVETPENITGDLEDLDTADKYTLVGAINELNSDIDNLTDNIIGDLEDLNTSSNYSVVDAINSEVADREAEDIDIQNDYNSKIGSLSNLDTTDKSSLVNAINELSNVLDPTQTADYINNSKGLLSGEVSTNATILADVQSYAHSTFDRTKFTVTGSPTITDDGIASGFSSSNKISHSLSLTGSKLVMTCGFNYVSTDSEIAAMGLFITGTTAGRCSINSSGDVAMYVPASTNENIKVTSSDITLTTGDFIYAICEYNEGSTSKFTVTNVTRGQTVTKTGTANWNKNIRDLTSMYCGSSGSNNPFNSTIDLKYYSIFVDGIPVFNGNKTGIDTIKADDYAVVGSPTISDDGVASGFSDNDYLTVSDIITSLKDKSFKITGIFKLTESTSGNLFYPNVQYGSYSFGVTYSVDASYKEFKFHYRWGNGSSADNSRYRMLRDGTNGANFNAGDIYEWYYELQFPNVLKFGIRKVGDTNWIEAEETDTTYGTGLQVINIATSSTVLQVGKVDNSSASIDLNSLKIYANGDLVYQPCLKIPYTESKTGSKVVDSYYRSRVNDMAEQFGYAPYYTLSDTDFTLPQGEIYGMIERNSTELNSKSDVDLSNVNDTAKILMAGMGMPSDTYVDLTLGTAGTTYTAPANGWVWFSKQSGGNTQYAYIGTSTLGTIENAPWVGARSYLYLPVKKGQQFTVDYDMTGNTQWFRFVYAQGSESEVQ